MELQDICGVCRMSMLRKPVSRLQPCLHLFHERCVDFLFVEVEDEVEVITCPICRQQVIQREVVERKEYIKHSIKDRELIIVSANRGDDWVALSKQLNVPYKTAYHWVRSGNPNPNHKGGKKPKILNEEQIDRIIKWLEDDSGLTLVQIKEKVRQVMNENISLSTVGNYLEGRLFTVKQVHYEPVTMNSVENKRKRAEYVQELNRMIELGKQIVYIDETNFNLFCRRTQGRAKAGNRAVQIRPAARGPNIHLIGAISAAGVVAMDRRRGSFTAQAANEWVTSLFQRWREIGNQLIDLVIVVDNAPCHRTLETVIRGTPVTLLRLAPYSPMLNPIEIIWQKIKASVKRELRIPNVQPPGIGEQRILYLENIIDAAKNTVVGGDCARAVQHSTIHHPAALALENVPVGR